MGPVTSTAHVIDAAELDTLFQALKRRDYTVIGPTAHDGAIHYEQIDSPADLPRGWGDEQGPGHYRLVRRDDEALFGYTAGPQSWKRSLHPPSVRLFSATRDNGSLSMNGDTGHAPRYAFLGVRPCELRAIGIQDRVFLGDDHPDPHYGSRRRNAFIVAVNCVRAGGTCFCTSMNSGPQAQDGYDIAMTEIVEGDAHYFLLEPGSDEGRQVCDELPARAADDHAVAAAEQGVQNAAREIQKHLDTEGLPDLLMQNLDHPRWEQVAQRCLSCGNCTMVCPTCFCTSVEDVTDLATDTAERWRHWDSCFTARFTYINGGNVRQSVRSRYRQWMTHKLSTWHDQFDSSGCVGCGRCVTWCPVGIDITEEAAAIRASDRRRQQSTEAGL